MAGRLWTERILVGSAIILVLTGVVMVYSASSIMADKRFHDSFYFLKRHMVYAFLGIVAMVIASKFDYHKLQKMAFPFLFVSFALLILLLVPGIGTEVGGAKRWLRVGPLSLQPAEVAKLAVIIFIAFSLTKKKDAIRDVAKGYLPYMMLLAVFIALLIRQPDFGNSMTLVSIVFIMLFVAGARFSHIIYSSAFMTVVAYMLIAGAEYRKKRILSFLDPWSDPLDTGFQIIQSFLAFGSGGMMGRGLGEGRQKLFYLPEPHTDFILPVIGEELGLLGVILIVLLFAGIVFAGIRASLRATDLSGCYLAMGISSMIGMQAIVNMGVVMGLLPTKGLPLPFVSYGGTSLLVNMTAVGILASVAARGRA